MSGVIRRGRYFLLPEQETEELMELPQSHGWRGAGLRLNGGPLGP